MAAEIDHFNLGFEDKMKAIHSNAEKIQKSNGKAVMMQLEAFKLFRGRDGFHQDMTAKVLEHPCCEELPASMHSLITTLLNSHRQDMASLVGFLNQQKQAEQFHHSAFMKKHQALKAELEHYRKME